MQSFVDKGPVYHEAGVVEAGAEVGGDNVEVVRVGNGDGTLVGGEEGRGGNG